jgi:hypothetical protein
VVRKILTKPIWWLERNRSYPVRSRFDRLPPIPVHKAPRRYVVLTARNTLNDALWTAWSWYRYLHNWQFELQIVVDGKITKAEESAAGQLFPGVRIDDAESVVADLCGSQPGLATFLQHHPLGKKLGLMLAMSQESAFLYSDHDVLAFNLPAEVLNFVEKDTPFYMVEEHEGNLDPVIVEGAKSLGLEYISRLNSGLLYIPRGALSLDMAVQLLTTWRPPVTSWFTEQTVLSVLMCHANAIPLPRDRYVVSTTRQFYWEKDVDYSAIAARHFTGTVRHVMYKCGIPTVLQQSRSFLKEQGNV